MYNGFTENIAVWFSLFFLKKKTQTIFADNADMTNNLLLTLVHVATFETFK